MKWLWLTMVLGLLPLPAWAYSASARYGQDTMKGGGGGRFFTGSPRDNFTCDVCHDDAIVGPDLTVSGLPQGGYNPGQIYPVRLTWDPGPLETAEDTFAVVAEMFTEGGEISGSMEVLPAEDAEADSLCAAGVAASQVFDAEAGRQVIAMAPCGAKQVRFLWTAPPAPAVVDECAPDVVLYAAAMQGDESMDPSGDALSLRAQRVVAASGACEHDESASGGGCRAGRKVEMNPLWLVLLGIGLMRRERKR